MWRQAVAELKEILGRLALNKSGVDKIDPLDKDKTIDDLARNNAKSQILLPIHKENLQICRSIAKLEN